jgi:hypothetical protein
MFPFDGAAHMVAFVRTAWLLVERAVTKIHGLSSLLHHALIDARQTRTRLEAELFRNRYRLSSKNDDDLPIVR